jgi:hypothetical protein
MRRSKFARDFAVIFGSNVFVSNKNGDRGAECFPFENARQNFAAICFFPLRRQFALAGTTSIELALNFRFGNFDARRATIDDYADTAAMGFAKCGHAKQLAKCVAHERQE